MKSARTDVKPTLVRKAQDSWSHWLVVHNNFDYAETDSWNVISIPQANTFAVTVPDDHLVNVVIVGGLIK